MHERYFDAMDGRMMACRIHLEGLKESQLTKKERRLCKFSFWTSILMYLLFPAHRPAVLPFHSTEAQRGCMSCQVSTSGRETAVQLPIFFKSGFTWHSTIALRLCLKQMMIPTFSRSLNFLKNKIRTSPSILKKLHSHRSSPEERL